jgi:hypothetical protein
MSGRLYLRPKTARWQDAMSVSVPDKIFTDIVVSSETALSCLAFLGIQLGTCVSIPAIRSGEGLDGENLSISMLVELAGQFGLTARHGHLDWQLLQLAVSRAPILLLLKNTNAVVVIGNGRSGIEEIVVSDPLYRAGKAFILPRVDLEQAWDGDALIIAPRLYAAKMLADEIGPKPSDRPNRPWNATPNLPPLLAPQRSLMGRKLMVSVGILPCLLAATAILVMLWMAPGEERTATTYMFARKEQALPTTPKDTPSAQAARSPSADTVASVTIPAITPPGAAAPSATTLPRVGEATPPPEAVAPSPTAPPPVGETTSPPEAVAPSPTAPPPVGETTSPPEAVVPSPTAPPPVGETTSRPGAVASSPTAPLPIGETTPPPEAAALSPTAPPAVGETSPLPGATAAFSTMPLPDTPSHTDTSRSASASPTIEGGAGTARPNLSARDIETLVARGDDFLRMGDISSARLFYQRGADAGEARSALRLGATFDPAFLERAHLPSSSGNMDQAVFWYRRAHALGSSEAEILLKRSP